MQEHTENRENRAAGIWPYFGLILLFSIPVVGFIACIVFSFAPKNKGLRNFSRAVLIWMVVGLLILALLIAAVLSALSFAMDALFAALHEATGGEIGSFRDLTLALEALEDTVESYGGPEKLLSDLSELDTIAQELGGWDKIIEKLRSLEHAGEAAGDLGSLLQQQTQGAG